MGWDQLFPLSKLIDFVAEFASDIAFSRTNWLPDRISMIRKTLKLRNHGSVLLRFLNKDQPKKD